MVAAIDYSGAAWLASSVPREFVRGRPSRELPWFYYGAEKGVSCEWHGQLFISNYGLGNRLLQ